MPPMRLGNRSVTTGICSLLDVRQLPSYIFFEPRSSVRFSPSCGELCGSMPLDGLHCSPFATCGVENPRYYDGGQCISAVASPETPTLLDVLGVRGRLNLHNHERSLPSASPTRIVWGWHEP